MREGYIAILNYGLGNIKSVLNAFRFLDLNVLVTGDVDKIRNARGLVVPGVSAFGACIRYLAEKSLDAAIVEHIKSGKPYLGICLGYQMLFESSEESPEEQGLGLIKGKVVRFSYGLKVPHIGWNTVTYKNDETIFDGIKQDTYFYFVHSYFPVPAEDVEAGSTHYGIDFASAIEKDNIWATQFHPERSSTVGLIILRNFARRCFS